MRRMLIVAVIGALVAGCGPSKLEQRVCDMYAEQGIGTFDNLVKYFSSPSYVENQEAIRRLGGVVSDATPEELAREAIAARKQEIRTHLSARLNLSLREVDAALKKCGPKT